MIDNQARKNALRRYIVFRYKTIEFLDMSGLHKQISEKNLMPNIPLDRRPSDFATSLRTILLSWFCIFVDKTKNGMNVIDLWRELFPTYRNEIDAAWLQMEPGWNTLRNFRNKAGFHAAKALDFLKAREAIIRENKDVTNAVRSFQAIFSKLYHAEPDILPDLEDALDDLLDEIEKSHGKPVYNRTELKRYLMIPISARP